MGMIEGIEGVDPEDAYWIREALTRIKIEVETAIENWDDGEVEKCILHTHNINFGSAQTMRAMNQVVPEEKFARAMDAVNRAWMSTTTPDTVEELLSRGGFGSESSAAPEDGEGRREGGTSGGYL